MQKTKSHTIILSLFLLILLTGCTELSGYGSPGYNNSYADPYYGPPRGNGYGYGYDDRDWRNRQDRRDIERERDRLEKERRDLERERWKQENSYTPPPVARPREQCPSGFSPSEQKCSPEERRRGCKDMRLPGGLGCVRR